MSCYLLMGNFEPSIKPASNPNSATYGLSFSLTVATFLLTSVQPCCDDITMLVLCMMQSTKTHKVL